jgi:hypothetical protein
MPFERARHFPVKGYKCWYRALIVNVSCRRRGSAVVEKKFDGSLRYVIFDNPKRNEGNKLTVEVYLIPKMVDRVVYASQCRMQVRMSQRDF